MFRLFIPLLLAILLSGRPVAAQDLTLPSTTIVPHYRLAIGCNSTTVLIFPARVEPPDRGTRDILAQKQPGVDNVLKLKAARLNFPPTNLHVFTGDGRLYAFDVFFTDSLSGTYNLRFIDSVPAHPIAIPAILLAPRSANTADMTRTLQAITNSAPFLHVRTREFMMSFKLQSIHESGGLLFFRFAVANRSDLDYLPDFTRLYITDRRRVKRTSVQDHEILPIYSDSLGLIPGRAQSTFIVSIPRFTIPNGKQFRIELFERNGGRNLSLAIKNKYLFAAKKI
jgi:conjugative transposon TraN protein